MSGENKTKEEIPAGKRCCFCFPFRYGLTTWGYFKMTVTAFFIFVISYALLHTCMMLEYNGSEQRWTRIYADIGITGITLTLLVTDLLFTMLFVVGEYQKNMKRLRPYFFFSIAVWAMTILLTAMAVSLSVESWLSRHMSPRSFIINVLNFTAYFVVIIVETYFVLILKNETIMMRKYGEFRFKKNAADAECTMKCDKKAADDTDTEED